MVDAKKKNRIIQEWKKRHGLKNRKEVLADPQFQAYWVSEGIREAGGKRGVNTNATAPKRKVTPIQADYNNFLKVWAEKHGMKLGQAMKSPQRKKEWEEFKKEKYPGMTEAQIQDASKELLSRYYADNNLGPVPDNTKAKRKREPKAKAEKAVKKKKEAPVAKREREEAPKAPKKTKKAKSTDNEIKNEYSHLLGDLTAEEAAYAAQKEKEMAEYEAKLAAKRKIKEEKERKKKAEAAAEIQKENALHEKLMAEKPFPGKDVHIMSYREWIKVNAKKLIGREFNDNAEITAFMKEHPWSAVKTDKVAKQYARYDAPLQRKQRLRDENKLEYERHHLKRAKQQLGK